MKIDTHSATRPLSRRGLATGTDCGRRRLSLEDEINGTGVYTLSLRARCLARRPQSPERAGSESATLGDTREREHKPMHDLILFFIVVFKSALFHSPTEKSPIIIDFSEMSKKEKRYP